MNDKLIILAGMPRSGTTWIGKIIDSHPDTVYFHEPDNEKRKKIHIPTIVDIKNSKKYEADVQKFIQRLPYLRNPFIVGKSPIFKKRHQNTYHYYLSRGLIPLYKLWAKHLWAVNMPNVMKYDRKPGVYLLWKSIAAVGQLGVIVRTAKVHRAVLLIRHPCAVYASTIRGLAKGKFQHGMGINGTSWKLLLSQTEQAKKYGLTITKMESMSPIKFFAWKWVLLNEKAMEDIGSLKNCKHIKYEEFAADPLLNAKNLFEYIGLTWNQQCQDFVIQSTSQDSYDYYGVYKNPKNVANKWKTELNSHDIDTILSITMDSLPGKLNLAE